MNEGKERNKTMEDAQEIVIELSGCGACAMVMGADIPECNWGL